MNEDEIKALSERALEMLEEQQRAAKEEAFAKAMDGIIDDIINPALEEYKVKINEMIEQEEHNDKT